MSCYDSYVPFTVCQIWTTVKLASYYLEILGWLFLNQLWNLLCLCLSYCNCWRHCLSSQQLEVPQLLQTCTGYILVFIPKTRRSLKSDLNEIQVLGKQTQSCSFIWSFDYLLYYLLGIPRKEMHVVYRLVMENLSCLMIVERLLSLQILVSLL